MTRLTWWMRIVGAFYVLQFVMMAIIRAPIRAQGPEGALAQNTAGDPTAMFLVDTWVTFGLEVGAIGVVLIMASRMAGQAKAPVLAVWMVIHTVIIVTGLLALRGARPAQRPA